MSDRSAGVQSRGSVGNEIDGAGSSVASDALRQRRRSAARSAGPGSGPGGLAGVDFGGVSSIEVAGLDASCAIVGGPASVDRAVLGETGSGPRIRPAGSPAPAGASRSTSSSKSVARVTGESSCGLSRPSPARRMQQARTVRGPRRESNSGNVC